MILGQSSVETLLHSPTGRYEAFARLQDHTQYSISLLHSLKKHLGTYSLSPPRLDPRLEQSDIRKK